MLEPRAAKPSLPIALCVLSLSWMGGAVDLAAQTRADPAPRAGTSMPSDGRRQADAARRSLVRRYTVAQPRRAENGERLVGMVDDRVMTQPELEMRLRLIMDGAQASRHPDPIERRRQEMSRRSEYGRGILEEWAETTALALEAEQRGYSVNQQEIRESLAQLSEGVETRSSEGTKRLKAIGFPQELILGEIRDGLLVEKFINATMDGTYDAAAYRRIFNSQPAAFLVPPRVRAFRIFRMIDSSMTEKQRATVRKEFKRLRRILSKRKPKFEDLRSRASKLGGVTLGDTGWITADTPMSPVVIANLFRLETDKTSDVFEDEFGIYVVRILEREEGSDFSFDDALPQIKNYVFAKVKHAAYLQVEGNYRILLEPSGLNDRREVTEEEYRRYVASGGDLAALDRPAAAGRGFSEPISEKPPAQSRPPVPRKPRPAAPAVDLSILNSLKDRPATPPDRGKESALPPR